MATQTTTNKILPLQIFDFSGAVQRKTTKFLRKDNELEESINADYQTIGGISKRSGYAQIGPDFTSSSTTTSTTTSSSTSSSTTSTSTTSTSSSTTSTSSSTTSSSTSTTSTSVTSTSSSTSTTV